VSEVTMIGGEGSRTGTAKRAEWPGSKEIDRD
jgi:hypothetical protein